MAAYKTGVSKRLTVSGTTAGVLRRFIQVYPSYWWEGAKADFWVGAPWSSGYVKASCPSISPPMTALMTVEAATGYGSTASQSMAGSTENPLSVDLAGTLSLYVDAEEWIEVTEGGTAPGGVEDGTQRTKLRHFWKTRIGGKAGASISLGGVAASCEDTLTSAVEVAGWSASAYVEANAYYATESASLRLKWLDGRLPAWTHTSEGMTIATGTAGVPGQVEAILTASTSMGVCKSEGSVAPDKGYAMPVSLRRWDGAHPGPITLRIATKGGTEDVPVSGGAATVTRSQLRYSCGGTIGGTAYRGPSADEWSNLTLEATAESLSAIGEDASDRRVLLRGAVYDAMEVSQAGSHAVDAGGWSVTHGTPVNRSYSPAVAWGGYRYVAISGDRASTELRLTIRSRQWEVTTDGSGDAVVDLCSPTNASDATDDTDHRWEATLGPYWGVQEVSALTLAVLTSGATYTVAGMELARVDHTLLTALRAFGAWDLQEVATVGSVTTWTYRRRFLDGETDGRRSLEETDFLRVDSDAGSGSTSYVRRTIEQLADAIVAVDSGVVRWPGWQAALKAAIDVADGAAGSDWRWNYLNRNRPASWIAGDGRVYSSGAWSSPIDLAAASTLTLRAQMLLDEVEWSPGAGDLFGLDSGHADPRLLVPSGKVWRGQAWGLVLGTDGAGDEGALVTMVELPSLADRGSGRADARGEYRTGSPHSVGGLEHRISAEVGAMPFPSVDATMYGRHRRRACFRRSDTVEYRCIEADSPRGWMHVGTGKRIRTYYVDWTLAFESDEYGAVDQWVRLRVDSRWAVLAMLGREGASSPITWRVLVSRDGGSSGREVVSVTARSAVIERDSERGMLVLLWEAEGDVQRRVSLDGGATWEAAGVVMYGGAALQAELLDMAQDPRRGVMGLACQVSGALVVLESRDVGASWRLALS